MKNVPTVFLMTDSQVAEESFLVLINDFLASGEVPGLFQDDELENIINAMKPQVKFLGLQDTRENCWKLFIEKVRRQLKVSIHPGGGACQTGHRKWCFHLTMVGLGKRCFQRLRSPRSEALHPPCIYLPWGRVG